MSHRDRAFLSQLEALGPVFRDEPLAAHTTFGIGGPADYYLVVKGEEALCRAVVLARPQGIPFFLLGRSSNILVSDRGIRGLVIDNRAQRVSFNRESWPQELQALETAPHVLLYAESGAPVARLTRLAARRGLAGLAWAIGIPGSIGGAVVFNAGAHDHCLEEVLQGVRLLDAAGHGRWVPAPALGLGYRQSCFTRHEPWAQGAVILGVGLALTPSSPEALYSQMAAYLRHRRRTQPLRKNAGSIFKNPPQTWAGYLIEQAGLKGYRIGNAQISPKHANFIVNLGGACAQDVKALIDLAREKTWQQFGIALELEIELVGQWGEGEGRG